MGTLVQLILNMCLKTNFLILVSDSLGSDSIFYEKLCGSTILENMPRAQSTDDFDMKLRYSLRNVFYTLKNITILNRNNNGKRQIQIMKMKVSWFRDSRTTSVVCWHLHVLVLKTLYQVLFLVTLLPTLLQKEQFLR